MGGNLCNFFSHSRYRFFSRMDDQAMHDEWRHGSGSTSSARGRGSNPTSANGPSVPYRGQCVAFRPEYFVPQESGGNDSQGARGCSGSRGRGGLKHGSCTSTGVEASTKVGQERRGTRRPTESQSDSRGTSQSSGSKRHKARHRLSSEARMHCRRLVLAWFENHSMIHLEK